MVGLDFLQFGGVAPYTGLVLNPPFRHGVDHVLHGWDSLWQGEIAAIVNAESLRNPFSAARRRLADLVASHGGVEFIEGAFQGPDVERPANVDVALVHLCKSAQVTRDWLGPAIEQLARDDVASFVQSSGFKLPTELALQEGFVEQQCRFYRLAVGAMKEAVLAQSVARVTAARLGRTMVEIAAGDGAPSAVTREEAFAVHKQLAEGHRALKDSAWASILRSTAVLGRLSSQVQKAAEARFNEIQALEFTPSNVYGFLQGLVESQGELQIDMLLEVFDCIGRYHSDNAVYFKGWKSNDKHRRLGMRLKTTRFVLPGHKAELNSPEPKWGTTRLLADIDKVFAILDGKSSFPGADGKGQVPNDLVAVFRQRYPELKAGQRVTSAYFDLRFYPRAGTLHFFPRRKDLMDRLNRLVGARRAWLPPAEDLAPTAFWDQYERAEALGAEMQEDLVQALREQYIESHGSARHFRADAIPHQLSRAVFAALSEDPEQVEVSGYAMLDSAVGCMNQVLERHGLLGVLPPAEEVLRLAVA